MLNVFPFSSSKELRKVVLLVTPLQESWHLIATVYWNRTIFCIPLGTWKNDINFVLCVCVKPFSKLSSLYFCTVLWQEGSKKRASKKGRLSIWGFWGFVSKADVVWLNYKRTCLITSLSWTCQELHPKNKTWHIKKKHHLLWMMPMLSLAVRLFKQKASRWQPEHFFSSLICLLLLTLGASVCCVPVGTLIRAHSAVSWHQTSDSWQMCR